MSPAKFDRLSSITELLLHIIHWLFFFNTFHSLISTFIFCLFMYRGSAAASTARDMVFGPSTKSKSVHLPKLLAELAALQRVVVSSNSSAHRGLAGNLQDERPGSAGRWSPVSDGSEAWLTWYVSCITIYHSK